MRLLQPCLKADMLNITETMRKYEMISQREHVLVAVSGGADSIALLYSLLEVREAFALKLSVCHINHNLRGDESEKDAELVRNICEKLDLPFFYFSVNIDTKGLSLEEAARNVRYAHLYKCGIKKIALGHNQNDNAETLLLRLCRGTGLSGLKGIPPKRIDGDFTLIRPLIEINREEIENYLHKINASYRTDKSNYDDSFARNRIRHNVLPELQKINYQAIKNLAKSAELLKKDAELLAFAKEPQTKLHIPTMQRNVIHGVLSQIKGLKDVTQKHIEQIERLLTSQSGKEIHLPGGFYVRKEYDYLIIDSKKDTDNEGFCLELSTKTPTFIPITGQYVQSSVKSLDINSTINFSETCTKYFNYDKIVLSSVKIRSRKPGDRIYISGIGHKKLKDEFIDRKIPRSLRDSIPLLAQGSDVLWIIDEKGRTSDEYKPKIGKKMLIVEVLRDGK